MIPVRPPIRRALATFALLLALVGAAPASAAAPSCTDRDNLMSVDEAFSLSAEATASDRISLRWKIAPNCYLYRHQIKVQSDAGFVAQPLQLPPGQPHDDETFGRVETYRNSLTATLSGEARAARTTLKVRYQGCADAGICYPPQTRNVVVTLAAANAPAADEPVVAFGNRGARSPGAPLGGGLLVSPAGATDAMPLPAEQAFGFEAIVGDGNTLLLRFTPARGYYLYRDKTSLKLDAAAGKAGIALGQPTWPKGTPHRDEHFGNVVVYFDQIDVPLPLRRTRTGATPLTITARFQGCQTDGICYPPMTRAVTLQLPAGTLTPVPDAAAMTTTSSAAVASTDTATPIAPLAGEDNATADRTPPAPVAHAATSAAAPRGASLNLFSALLLALAGGLILNLMPCVLPVLSLKALSLAGNGQDPARARRHALWYTSGVVLSFALLGGLVLALRQTGLALGWGFQLQQPLFVALMALLMFGLALSMSGVWHVGGRWTGAGHALTTQSGPMGDFFTGALAVVVATPCTAPYMGLALAWAFTAPTGIALLVFVMLGLGMALPFLLIGLIPALAHRLPRPGAWMETFKQALAFPLYLTAAWLAWVLANQRGADAIGWWMFAAVLLAFAAWAWTRARSTGHRWAMVAVVVATLALIWPLRMIHSLPHPSAAASVTAPSEGVVAVPFSEQRLAELRADGHVVFVNMTADWCVTCKVNERAVFRSDAFREAMQASNGVYMVGDWTDVDPALTAFLQRYKAVGVPLYVVFPPGTGESRVLPVVLTTGTVRTALNEAAGARR